MAASFLHEKSKLLILLLIVTESIFFAFLIAAFVLYHGDFREGPSPYNSLAVGRTAIFSIILWASSLTMWFSERAMRQMNFPKTKRWLEVTMILGAVFLAGQGVEYHGFFSRNITPQTDLFATTFFTTTGFHALHVFIGLIVLLILRGLTSGGFGREGYQREGYGAASYYWHFVDGVWVAVFFILYVWGTR
jgi:cytochrome c oxidase subunit III